MRKGALLMAASLVMAWGGMSQALAGDAAAGEQLANTFCAACHGPGGEGMGPNPPLAGMSEELFVGTMHAFRSGKRESATMGALSGGLTDEQFKDLAAYYGQFEPVAHEFRIDGPLHHVSASVCQTCHEDNEMAQGNPHIPTGKVDTFGQVVPASLPLQGNPRMMRSSELCLGCHHLRPNPQGVPLCATGDEIEASGSQVTCQSCHMPIAEGFANHSMGGGHDPAMLSRAVKLTVDVEPNGDGVKAHVVMENQLPHKMPTGAPFRNVQVKVTALDAAGNVLWTNFEKHAQQEDPRSYLFYQLADDEGKPSMPPTATQVGIDSRLEPHERRVLTYDIPVQPAVVRAELLYNLVFEGMKPRIRELSEDANLDARRMAFYEARL
jgi:cytochrome c553